MKNIFFFNTMLTSKLITFCYWVMLLSSLASGCFTIFGNNGFRGLTFGQFISGILIIIGGCVISRIICELLIVGFMIHENILRIADVVAATQGTGASNVTSALFSCDQAKDTIKSAMNTVNDMTNTAFKQTKCSQCNSAVSKDEDFCSQCGNSLQK